MKHDQIPNIVYDNLRAVNESRAHRHDTGAIVPHLSNLRIFAMMPDHREINWDKDYQAGAMASTLEAMARTVEWSQ
jgi:hypothetical protein